MYLWLKIYVKHCYRFRRTTRSIFWHYLDCFREPTICILVQVVILGTVLYIKICSNDNGSTSCVRMYILFGKYFFSKTTFKPIKLQLLNYSFGTGINFDAPNFIASSKRKLFQKETAFCKQRSSCILYIFLIHLLRV
jgi:hypothetical protein